jgi:hypothetical protein
MNEPASASGGTPARGRATYSEYSAQCGADASYAFEVSWRTARSA